MDNIKNEDIDDINNTVRFNLKQVLDKNKILSLNSVLTNSISTTRSKNEEPIKFEDIYLRLDNYDFALDNDFNKFEHNAIEAEFTVNNFVTSFEFLQEDDEIGSESFLSNETSYKFNNANSLKYRTRRNKKTD